MNVKIFIISHYATHNTWTPYCDHCDLIQPIIRLHQSIVLNIMRKAVTLSGCVAPRLKPNLLLQLTREALGPLAARIMASDVFDGVGMDILLVSTDVIWNPESAPCLFMP